MIKPRLARHGSTNNAFYRIVAVEERSKRSGKVLDVVGYWHPPKNNKQIDKDKVEAWMLHGAQQTDAVKKLLD